MEQKKAQLLAAGIALGLLVALGALTAAAAPALQEEPPAQEGPETGPPNLGAQYMGASVCQTCHSDAASSWRATAHAHFIQRVNDDTPILGDLTDAQALTITWPDGERRPITREDITYVLGGRYVQRYISVREGEDGAEAYYVLPVQWNIPQEEGHEGTWTPYHADDWTAPERDWRVACAGCHVTGLTAEMVAEGWTVDRRIELGISCESCHGPGGDHIRRPAENAVVVSPDAQICGQCHIQGMDPTGEHGYPVGYQPGLPLDETVFIPTGMDDAEAWWPSGHARIYNAYSEWLHSDHATALESVLESAWAEESCLRCHATQPAALAAAIEAGEEGATWDLHSAAFGVTCAACHDVHPAVDDEGQPVEPRPALLRAAPYETCVSCHASLTEEGDLLLVDGRLHHPVQPLFEGWSIIEGIQGIPSTHFRVMGEESCTTCHMLPTVQIGEYGRVSTHTMDVVFPGETVEGQPDSCNGCHDNISKEAMQQFIDRTQASVARRLRHAEEVLRAAPDAPPWVAKALDFVRTDGSYGIHNYAYTDALLYAAEVQLGLMSPTAWEMLATVSVQDPATCAQCHRDVHDLWQTSPHGNASLSDAFMQDLAAQGAPSYCFRCHASGYDPATEQYVFEGVVCSSCHFPIADDAPHPPAPMQASKASLLCGQCHSGAHAPTYNEWLTSAHSLRGVDCVDCHTPHDNGLILGDVNTTCGSCHPEAVTDEVHMGDDLTCVDCHMTRRLAQDGIHVLATGHAMTIDPGTCAQCHGNVHVLTARTAPETPEEARRAEQLEQQVAELEIAARQNQTAGIIGGAVGMLVMAAVAFAVLRRGRIL